MTEFTKNNAKNTNIDHISVKLNFKYYRKVLFEDAIDFYSKSCSANKLAKELKELIEIYYRNLLHA